MGKWTLKQVQGDGVKSNTLHIRSCRAYSISRELTHKVSNTRNIISYKFGARVHA